MLFFATNDDLVFSCGGRTMPDVGVIVKAIENSLNN
jgi:ribonucleotide monophosphatase NagD (HAD superfamily)